MPKILYVFGYSVWLELGYSESEVTQKTVTLVNGDNFDPSFLKILCYTILPIHLFALMRVCNKQELAAKASGLQGMFLANRQAAFQRYIADPAAGEYKDFYKPRIAANGGEETFGGLLEIFTCKAPADVQAGYFVQSQAHFDAVRSALFEVYWGAWAARESWKKVYAETLH
ncbi:hypothetical protein DFH08DRAFT_806261 [Mycena albidolilacea]|uniref:Uncharacterized protein n=1 Tax=Mycena albidolilacea TaxID=1033008 RepID=A0AAD7A7X9_9AGAR|nr:hypothetical protein DFH08DRAFT_806261 [Mycena albidolilacea]